MMAKRIFFFFNLIPPRNEVMNAEINNLKIINLKNGRGQNSIPIFNQQSAISNQQSFNEQTACFTSDKQAAHFTFNLIFFVLVLGLAIAQNSSGNTSPEVHNLYAQQRSGTRLVDITFDLVDADGDILSVTVEASDDNGATWTIRPHTLSGDFGDNIIPGNGKEIVWDVGKDLPGVKNPNFKVRLIVDDGNLPFEEIVSEKDGARMRLIPAGEFEMGYNDGDSDEKPVHTVYLDDFYIDVYEVTNAMYANFLNAVGKHVGDDGNVWLDIGDGDELITLVGGQYRPKPGFEKHPVIEVSWYGAVAYAQWAGKRLPTEAEWEKAARGGLVGKKYPWGDEISHDDANYSGTGGRDQWEKTAPVGSFPPNGYSLYDMAGNVWEWCADWYGEDYYANSPPRNPQGPENGIGRICRGGSWYGDTSDVRSALRVGNYTSYSYNNLGFRCCVSSP